MRSQRQQKQDIAFNVRHRHNIRGPRHVSIGVAGGRHETRAEELMSWRFPTPMTPARQHPGGSLISHHPRRRDDTPQRRLRSTS